MGSASPLSLSFADGTAEAPDRWRRIIRLAAVADGARPRPRSTACAGNVGVVVHGASIPPSMSISRKKRAGYVGAPEMTKPRPSAALVCDILWLERRQSAARSTRGLSDSSGRKRRARGGRSEQPCRLILPERSGRVREDFLPGRFIERAQRRPKIRPGCSAFRLAVDRPHHRFSLRFNIDDERPEGKVQRCVRVTHINSAGQRTSVCGGAHRQRCPTAEPKGALI